MYIFFYFCQPAHTTESTNGDMIVSFSGICIATEMRTLSSRNDRTLSTAIIEFYWMSIKFKSRDAKMRRKNRIQSPLLSKAPNWYDSNDELSRGAQKLNLINTHFRGAFAIRTKLAKKSAHDEFMKSIFQRHTVDIAKLR